MPSILIDKHHSGLYNSLLTLFEKRLGYTVYTQAGLEWYTEGLWSVYPHVDTAKQYLERDVDHGITYDKFKETPIDIVLCSIPAHIEPFKKLAAMKGAKFIFQAGNVFPEVEYSQIPNLMANTLPPYPPPHSIQYHQEFDTNIFHPTDAPPEKLIPSFINVYQNNGGFEDYLMLKTILPDFEFKSYGGQCFDGAIGTPEQIAALMQKSYFGFHVKRMGDGYGHVLYNWFACGKPIITRISDYKGKLGEELLIDEETCIDLDNYDYNGVSSIIMNMSPTKYSYMCQQVMNRFQEKVNFNQEADKLKIFMEELV